MIFPFSMEFFHGLKRNHPNVFVNENSLLGSDPLFSLSRSRHLPLFSRKYPGKWQLSNLFSEIRVIKPSFSENVSGVYEESFHFARYVVQRDVASMVKEKGVI